MAERNRDKIKRLEHELGRYQKKVGDLQKELARYKAEVENNARQITGMSMAFGAWLIAMALRYGENVRDEDGTDLGLRLWVDGFSAQELLEKYELKRRKDEVENRVYIGVMEREVNSSEAEDGV